MRGILLVGISLVGSGCIAEDDPADSVSSGDSGSDSETESVSQTDTDPTGGECPSVGDACVAGQCCAPLVCGDEDVCIEIACLELGEGCLDGMCCEGTACDELTGTCIEEPLECKPEGEACRPSDAGEPAECCDGLDCLGNQCRSEDTCTTDFCMDLPCCDGYECIDHECEPICRERGETCTGDDCCDGLVCGERGTCIVDELRCGELDTPCSDLQPCCDGYVCDAETSSCLPVAPECLGQGEPCVESEIPCCPEVSYCEDITGCQARV